MEDLKEYIFSLEVDGDVLDTTALDENNPELARDLFFNEFGWNELLNKKQKERAEIVLEGEHQTDEYGAVLEEGLYE